MTERISLRQFTGPKAARSVRSGNAEGRKRTSSTGGEHRIAIRLTCLAVAVAKIERDVALTAGE